MYYFSSHLDADDRADLCDRRFLRPGGQEWRRLGLARVVVRHVDRLHRKLVPAVLQLMNSMQSNATATTTTATATNSANMTIAVSFRGCYNDDSCHRDGTRDTKNRVSSTKNISEHCCQTHLRVGGHKAHILPEENTLSLSIKTEPRHESKTGPTVVQVQYSYIDVHADGCFLPAPSLLPVGCVVDNGRVKPIYGLLPR